MFAHNEVNLDSGAIGDMRSLCTVNLFVKRSFGLLEISPELSSRLDPCCDRHDVPYRAQVDQEQNRRFWTLCAASSLYQANIARENDDEAVARHLFRMFRLAQSNRRMLTHCRIIDPQHYAPITHCLDLLTRLYNSNRIAAYDESTFIPLLEPFSRWSLEVLGKDLTPYKIPSDATELLLEIQASIFLGLDIGVRSLSPTDCARLLGGFINDSIEKQLGNTETHFQIYKRLVDIKRFLTPFLLDVRHFKRKHRLDAFLN